MPLKIALSNKQSLNSNLKVLLPLLQSNIIELNEKINEVKDENPYLEIQKNAFNDNQYENIDDLSDEEPSLYELVLEQLKAPLFPTPISVEIAHAILNDISQEGYFEGDLQLIANEHNTSLEQVQKIHQRFMYLSPKGVGSRNFQECLLFQLYDLDLNQELYHKIHAIITDTKNLDYSFFQTSNHEINAILKNFNFPPALNYKEKEVEIVPDFIVDFAHETLFLSYNDSYTPNVIVNNYFKASNKELRKKLKEAKAFVELLNLRKRTLHKIVLFILEKQKDFFDSKIIKPLKLKDLAKEFNFSESTISRAVANKYIECNQGIFPLRSFFSYEVGKNHSLQEIKNTLKTRIHQENSIMPLSDEQLKIILNKEFELNLSRRAITKYRLALNIPSSRDRKKLHLLKTLS